MGSLLSTNSGSASSSSSSGNSSGSSGSASSSKPSSSSGNSSGSSGSASSSKPSSSSGNSSGSSSSGGNSSGSSGSASIGNRESKVPSGQSTSLTWVDIILGKMMASEQRETLLAMSEQERRNIAFTLGDPTAFYNHFFRTMPKEENKERMKDYEEIAGLLNDPELTPEAMDMALRRQHQFISQVAEGNGALEVAITFRELNSALQSWVLHKTARFLGIQHGTVHAAIVLNGATVLEWGCGLYGDSLVVPDDVHPAELAASFMVMRNESTFFMKVVKVITHPLEAAAQLFWYFTSLLGLFTARSKDLERMAELACKWNRTKAYHLTRCNCQTFASSLIEEVTGRPFEIVGGEGIIQEFMDNIAQGQTALYVPQYMRPEEAFLTAQALEDFISTAPTNSELWASIEAKYLLSMFHSIFLMRRMSPGGMNNPDWIVTNSSGFNWRELTQETSAAVGARTRVY